MNIIQAAILGIVQGASEFLPISSSAHLILVPRFFGFDDPGLAFDVALHIGTLFAVVLFFYRDWIDIFKITFSRDQTSNPKYSNTILYILILATIPGVLFGYFLEDFAETAFRSPLLIAFTLAGVGLVLYLVDKYHRHRKKMREIGWKESLFIGLSQALAIIPGVSRSGATITTGLAMGLSRESAARFSFLLSTPIIFGAAIMQLPALIDKGITAPVFVGVAASAISGFFAIKYLLKFVERSSYAIFFWYRLALAALIVLMYYLA